MPHAFFERFEFVMPQAAVDEIATPGPSDEAVEYWATKIRRPHTVTPEALREELEDYGAWEDFELEDDEINWERIIWIGACDIKEEQRNP